MPTPLEVFEGLKTVCLKLKSSDGYTITLEESKFNTNILPLEEGQILSSDAYPRGYLACLGTDYGGLPGKRQISASQFVLMIVLCFTPDQTEADPEIKMKSALQVQADVELLLSRNSQFAGTDTVVLTAFASDVALNSPETALVFDITVTYKRQL